MISETKKTGFNKAAFYYIAKGVNQLPACFESPKSGPVLLTAGVSLLSLAGFDAPSCVAGALVGGASYFILKVGSDEVIENMEDGLRRMGKDFQGKWTEAGKVGALCLSLAFGMAAEWAVYKDQHPKDRPLFAEVFQFSGIASPSGRSCALKEVLADDNFQYWKNPAECQIQDSSVVPSGVMADGNVCPVTAESENNGTQYWKAPLGCRPN